MIPERPFQLGAFCDSTQYWPQGWLPMAASRGKQLSKTHFTFYRAGCRAALVSLRYSQQQHTHTPAARLLRGPPASHPTARRSRDREPPVHTVPRPHRNHHGQTPPARRTAARRGDPRRHTGAAAPGPHPWVPLPRPARRSPGEDDPKAALPLALPPLPSPLHPARRSPTRACTVPMAARAGGRSAGADAGTLRSRPQRGGGHDRRPRPSAHWAMEEEGAGRGGGARMRESSAGSWGAAPGVACGGEA